MLPTSLSSAFPALLQMAQATVTPQLIQPRPPAAVSETQPLLNFSLQLSLTASAFMLFFAGCFSIRYGRAGLHLTHQVVLSIYSAFYLVFTNAFYRAQTSNGSSSETIGVISTHELSEATSASPVSDDADVNEADSNASGRSLRTSIS